MKFMVVLLALVGSALAQDKDLVDTLTDLGCSETVGMLQRANLEGVIRQGQFTVFAPTNAAWDALPEYIRRVIVGAPEYLAQVLTFHVTVDQVRAGDLENEKTIQSVEGSLIRANIYKDGSLVTVTGSPVSTVDVEASNGVIHLIDRLMFPIPRDNMYASVAFDPDLSTLASLVATAGLDGVLRDGGPFTLFAPSNAAFAEVPRDVLDDLLQNPEKLRAVLLYHVVGSSAWSVSLENGAQVTTLQGQTVEVTINNGGVMVNNAEVEFPDAAVSNGVIHYINKVLLPPTEEKDLVDTLTDLGCSDTVAMLQRANLEGVIRQGQFTVFAPTNAAWDALPEYIRRVIVGAPEYLAQVLTFHVTVDQVRAGDLENEKTIQSVEGSLIRANIYKDGSLVTVTGSPVSTVDVEASNGVIHLIDRLMFPLPRDNMYASVAFDPDLSTLASLVATAGLDGVLRDGGPFTLFAPSNTAFAEVPRDVLDDLLQNPEKLRAVLLYHVVGSTNWSASLENGAMVPTLQGQTVEITVNSGGVMVNNAEVEFPDAAVSNGVIHYINKVLLPPTEN